MSDDNAEQTGPFARPPLPSLARDPRERLRLVVVVMEFGRGDYLARVSRQDGIRYGACRAADPLAAVAGATAAALEVLRQDRKGTQ